MEHNEINNDVYQQNNSQSAEERYYKVSSIIEELAEKNPEISPKRVTMLKGIYHGDMRPIETIIEELDEYSSGLNHNVDAIYDKAPEKNERIVETIGEPVLNTSVLDSINKEESKNPKSQGYEQQTAISDELSDMFVPHTPSSAYYGLEQTSSDALQNPKQYVKINDTGSNEGGYAGTIAILTTAAVLSIITIVLAIAVLI